MKKYRYYITYKYGSGGIGSMTLGLDVRVGEMNRVEAERTMGYVIMEAQSRVKHVIPDADVIIENMTLLGHFE